MEDVEKKKKPIYKKWWFWLIIVIVIIGIGVGGNSNDTATVSQTNLTENQNTQETNTKVNVGETAELRDIKISFLSLNDYTNYNSYSAPKSGNKVIRVEFQFENISNGDVYLDNFECYADGEKAEEYYYPDDYKSPTLESLSAGKRIKSVLYYEVPNEAESIILEYDSSIWSNKKIEFIAK